MATKKAKACVKTNKLFEEAGWRFFDNGNGKTNVVLEPNVKLTKVAFDALGESLEETSKGFIDFLPLDQNGFPMVTLKAKSEDKNPQQAIVAETEAEQALVNANRELIACFEKKIQGTLARVWGNSE